MKKIKKLIYP